MSEYRLGILNGDDIGHEIVPVTIDVLKTAIARYPEIKVDWVPLPIGYVSFLENGHSLPDSTYGYSAPLVTWHILRIRTASIPIPFSEESLTL